MIRESISRMSMALAQFLLPLSVFLLNDHTNNIITLITGIALISNVMSHEVTDGAAVPLLSLSSMPE